MSQFNVHEWNRKRYLSEEEVNEAALSNQEIVAKVEEFINGPLNQLRKEVSAWHNSFEQIEMNMFCIIAICQQERV